jgi:hypothetical protein
MSCATTNKSEGKKKKEKKEEEEVGNESMELCLSSIVFQVHKV